MGIGDFLKDNVLGLAKEKGQEAAGKVLDEQAAAGGILGTAAGMGKGLLDNVMGGNQPENAGDSSGQGAEEISDSRDESSDDEDDR